MDVRQLRCFIAVLNEGSFTAAAARLHLSKATVSERIAHLEAEVGARLLERQPLTTTPAGLAFEPHARRMLDDVDSALAAVAEVRSGAEVLRVGHLTSGAADLNAPIYSALQKALPRTRIQSVELSLAGADAAVAEGRVDVAFLRDPVEDPRLVVVPLYATGRVAALAATHPLASAPALRVAGLDGIPVTAVHRRMNPATWQRYSLTQERNGTEGPTLESATFAQALMNVLVRGAVAAPSTGSARWLTFPGVRFIPLVDALPSGPIAVSRGGDGRPAVRAFMEIAAHVAEACDALVRDAVPFPA